METLDGLIVRFLADLPQQRQALQNARAAARQDDGALCATALAQIGSVAHRLAGLGGTLGFLAMSKTASLVDAFADALARTEGALPAGALAQLDCLVAELCDAIGLCEGPSAQPGADPLPALSGGPRSILVLGMDDDRLARQTAACGQDPPSLRRLGSAQEIPGATGKGTVLVAPVERADEIAAAGAGDPIWLAPVPPGDAGLALQALGRGAHGLLPDAFDLDDVIRLARRLGDAEPSRVALVIAEMPSAAFLGPAIELSGLTVVQAGLSTDPVDYSCALTPNLLVLGPECPCEAEPSIVAQLRQRGVASPVLSLSPGAAEAKGDRIDGDRLVLRPALPISGRDLARLARGLIDLPNTPA